MPPRNAAAMAAVAAPTSARRTSQIQRIQRSKAGIAVCIYGVPGIGKTTLAAGAENSLIISVGEETGYRTLVNNGQAPERDYCNPKTWQEFLDVIDEVERGDYAVVAIDSLSQLVNKAEKFAEETKGYENFWVVFKALWPALIPRLEAIREKGTHIVILAHCESPEFKNPDGDNYQRYEPRCSKHVWPFLDEWLDGVIFYTYQVVVKNEGASASKERKGQGGQTRILRASYKAASVAKQRLGLPDELIVPNDPAGVWDWFIEHALHANAMHAQTAQGDATQ